MRPGQKYAIAAAALLVVACDDNKPMAPGPQPPANAADVVQLLATAYRTQDFATFSVLLADDFLFILDEPNPDNGETQWDAATERRIHARMFDPQDIPMGDPSIPPDYWLQQVTVVIELQTTFTERTDLYTTFNPPGPLDPAQWIAGSAVYSYDVFIQLAGDTAYRAQGRLEFTVIEDRTKQVGDAGKFLLYRWEDLGGIGPFAVEASWTTIKRLYK